MTRPRRHVMALWALAALVVGPWVCMRSVFGQQPAEAALRSLEVADGFEVTLFASEPLVQNPTAIDVDARGRVWVTEGVNYRHTIRPNHGMVPDPAADRVKILEDTDGDGRADKVTVFADHILVPMSVAVAGQKVYVGESPNVWVFEDTDGDGKADKKESLLHGFRGRDHDHGVHGLLLGPDGRLYMTIGDEGMDVTDRSGRRVAPLNGAMLRVKLDGTSLVALADNFRNPYELAVDSFGNVSCSDNDIDGRQGVRICWIMESGNYGWKGPPSPTGDHWREDLPGYAIKILGTGNGSPCGILVYEGSLLPGRFRGSLIHADAGPRLVRAYHLKPKGAAYAVETEPLVTSSDNWFRPVDVAAAPDGSLYIADWYDGGVGGHAYRDNNTGRIYHLSPKGYGGKARRVKQDFGSIPGLAAALGSPTPAVRFLALEGFKQRGAEGVRALVELAQGRDTLLRARALQVLGQMGDAGRGAIVAALKDPDARFRAEAVRILREDAARNADLILPLAADSDVQVRREVILAARRLDTAKAGPALERLVRAWDGSDRHYLEALGLALRQREPDFIRSFFTDVPADLVPRRIQLGWALFRVESLPFLVREGLSNPSDSVSRAAVRAITEIPDVAAGEALIDYFGKTPDGARRRQILDALRFKLLGPWKELTERPAFTRLLSGLLKRPEFQLDALRTVGDGAVMSLLRQVLAMVRDEKLPLHVREAAVESLGRMRSPESLRPLEEIVQSVRQPSHQSTPPNGRPTTADALSVAALRALHEAGMAPERPLLRRLLTDRSYPLALRTENVRLMAVSNNGIRLILNVARAGELPPDLRGSATTFANRVTRGPLQAEVAEVLPLPKTAGGRPLAPANELLARAGDAAKGGEVFFRRGQQGGVCSRCHRVQGQGAWVGPDLSQAGTKLAKEALLDSILHPSAAVAPEYRSVAVALHDGRVVTGLITEEGPERLVMKNADGERVVLRAAEIEDKKVQDVSLMPEKLEETMTDAELVDLLAFLASLRQPATTVAAWHVVGPLPVGEGQDALARVFGPETRLDLRATYTGSAGRKVAWTPAGADREGLLDLTARIGPLDRAVAYAYTTVSSATEQEGRLVVESSVPLKLWCNGALVELGGSNGNGATGSTGNAQTVRGSVVRLRKGANTLLVKLAGNQGNPVGLCATLVSSQPLQVAAEGGLK